LIGLFAQITSDGHKLRAIIATFERIIITAFNQKLAPVALSTDVLNRILYHINDIAAKNKYNKYVHEPADLYKLEVSFIHCPEEHNIILFLHVPFVEAIIFSPYTNLFLCQFILTSASTSQSCWRLGRQTSSTLATQICFKLFCHQTLPAVNVLALLSSVRAAPSSRPTSFTPAWALSFLPVQL
jgi:hypothetical protein